MITTIKTLYLCVVVVFLCQYARGNEAEGTPRSSVGLSEISFYPREDGERWIEIANWGSNAVSVEGWCLVDGGGNRFAIPKEVPVVPAAGVVVVVVSSKAETKVRDLSFEKDGVVTLTWIRPETLSPYPDVSKGVCALYRDRSCTKDVAVDAVCWGFRENARDFAYPPSIGDVWPMYYKITTVIREKNEGNIGGRSITLGGALARVKLSGKRGFSDWFVCPPEYVSRGIKNRWLPPSVSNPDGFYGAALLQSFSWNAYGGGGAPCWRVQISRSDQFEDPLMDAQMRLQGMVCLPKINLAGAHLYYRVRGEGHGILGLWSEVIECDVESIEVLQDRMSDRRYREP